MQFNVAQKEIVLKVVYYGPPLSGKTTNLQAVHRALDGTLSGRLTTLNTADDRTLFFDLLPVMWESESGYKVKLKLFTVPGQVIHAATRRLVLAGADGVVFVADSQLSESKTNNEYWHGMRHYMSEIGIDPQTIPTIIQFNKRDLPNVRTDEELDAIRRRTSGPVTGAVAIRGIGVLETLRDLLAVMFADLNRRYDFEAKFGVVGKELIEKIFENTTPATESAGGAT